MVTGRTSLKRWLKAKDKPNTLTWLAGELGISISHAHNVVTGRRSPSLTLAAAIETLTGIKATDFAGRK